MKSLTCIQFLTGMVLGGFGGNYHFTEGNECHPQMLILKKNLKTLYIVKISFIIENKRHFWAN